ncbi:MAG: peptidoglycan-binding domain-containing protein [Mobilitalea sp.]
MKNRILIRIATIGMASFIAFTPVNAYAASLLKRGSRGNEVKVVQTTLKELGYYTYSKTTGYYGGITESAVKRFQKANGISTDGIIGKKTRNILFKKTKNISIAKVSLMKSTLPKVSDASGALDWFSKVKGIWKRGMDAIVTDVDTEKSFRVKRTYGTNHADVEPLTKEDTNIIKDIWGGFNWKRRAVIVQIGGYTLAGSMTGMPHAGVDSISANRYVSWRSDGYGRGYNLDAVKKNGASGVMDIHFKNSRTHTTNTMQKSQQDMVKKAAEYIKIWNLQQDMVKVDNTEKVKLAMDTEKEADKITENVNLPKDTLEQTNMETENIEVVKDMVLVTNEVTEDRIVSLQQ